MEAVKAMVLVKASGRNNFPSAPIMVNTGRKLIIVVNTAVRMAPETSEVALYTTVLTESCSGSGRSLFSSRCLIIFSERITPTSTMVPIAMAIPERATILASTPKSFMEINTISTATGSNPEISTEARRLNTITIITRTVISISSVRASLRVPSVSWISSVRS